MKNLLLSYHIKQTQGAEYGDEAEAIRKCFENALNVTFGCVEKEAECDECGWQGLKSEMDENEGEEIPFLSCPNCGGENIYYHK